MSPISPYCDVGTADATASGSCSPPGLCAWLLASLVAQVVAAGAFEAVLRRAPHSCNISSKRGWKALRILCAIRVSQESEPNRLQSPLWILDQRKSDMPRRLPGATVSERRVSDEQGQTLRVFNAFALVQA